MTDEQQGWNDALEIVLETFRDVAWQKDLAQERELAAAEMKKRVERKSLEQPQKYKQTMAEVVKPFCKTLNGECLPRPPFNITFLEAEGQGRIDALEIVLKTFKEFARRKDLQMNWTCSEIAEDMKKLVKYESREKSEDYRQIMADVVKPFCKTLKDEPSSGN